MILKKYLKDEVNIKNSIAVGSILRQLAKILRENEELWAMTGLVHNVDYEYSIGELEKRGNLAKNLLDGLLPEEGVNAIQGLNYMHTEYIPTTSLDKALIAAETASAFIKSIAKTITSQSVKDVDINMLMERFNDPEFAARFNRARIKVCVDIGFEVEEFLKVCLIVLQKLEN